MAKKILDAKRKRVLARRMARRGQIHKADDSTPRRVRPEPVRKANTLKQQVRQIVAENREANLHLPGYAKLPTNPKKIRRLLRRQQA